MRIWGVVRSELVCRLRSEPPHLVLALSVMALGLLAVIPVWLIDALAPHPAPLSSFSGLSLTSSGGWDRVLASHRADLLFLILTLGLALLAAAIGPIAACASLNRERDRGALESLLLTGLNPLTIVAGKFVAALARTLLTLGAGLPTFAVAWLFGGVSWAVIGLSVGAIVALAVLGVALGLFMSAITRSGVAATLYAYAALGLVALALPAALLVAFALGADGRWHSLIFLSMPVALLGAHGPLIAAIYQLMPFPFRDMFPPSVGAGVPIALDFTLLGATIGGYVAAAGILVVLSTLFLDPLHPLRAFRLSLPWRGGGR